MDNAKIELAALVVVAGETMEEKIITCPGLDVANDVVVDVEIAYVVGWIECNSWDESWDIGRGRRSISDNAKIFSTVTPSVALIFLFFLSVFFPLRLLFPLSLP